MKKAGFSGTVQVLLSLAGAALLSACSGSGSSSGSSFGIVSCNLGCSSSGLGQITCTVQNVHKNGEIRIAMSGPVDLDTVSPFTFQVVEEGTGKTPAGTYLLSPSDPATVIFRPKITFDSSGSPVFGLQDGVSYTVRLPGAKQDPSGPWVRSVEGDPNQNRLLCTVAADLGLLDAKPGAPVVAATLEQVLYDPDTGEAIGKQAGVPAAGAVDVASDSALTFRFDDLMDPATLVNPVQETSSTIRVAVDADGDPATTGDQQAVPGGFILSLDQDELTTVVTFQPTDGYPSKGSNPDQPRRIVVTLSGGIQDLAGNPLENAGLIVFTPELLVFGELDLVEDFVSEASEDTLASGAEWGGGRLAPGLGGGSGAHGAFALESGVVELNTDSTDLAAALAGAVVPQTALAAVPGDGGLELPVVEGGVFEFSSLRLGPGATLRFTGSRPGRIFVRGEATLSGRIELGGAGAANHVDTELEGGAGAAPGPAGGAGGRGGALPDGEAFVAVGGIDHPGDPTLAELDGQPGQGIAWPDLLAPAELRGAGGGGFHWPQSTPANPQYHLPVDPFDLGGLEFGLFECRTFQKGSVGGGGAHGTSGTAGVNNPLPDHLFDEAPPAVAGSVGELELDALARTLDPELGLLRGGAGGGGGGSHIARSSTDGAPPLAGCLTSSEGGPASIVEYLQHSGPGGGGGGGALQVQAGRRLAVDGEVDASGGDGGGRDPSSPTTVVTAGGGGAGGGLLVQARALQVSSVPGRLDVSGGAGGSGAAASAGGLGGAGLLRIEVPAPLPGAEAFADKILPGADGLEQLSASLDDVLSVGEWTAEEAGPGRVTGAQSCWIGAEGNYFVLGPASDQAAAGGEPGQLGWDLLVEVDVPGLGPQSFRGENELFDQPLEAVFGSALGSAPLVVRFQGVRVADGTQNPCSIALDGPDAAIVPGSLTGWVSHPAELDTFFENPSLRPNRLRFSVLFDPGQEGGDLITAVSQLSLRVLPD